MKLTQILTFCFLAVGIYLILCDLFHMPTLASTKAALKLTQEKKPKWRQAITIRLSAELAKHIRLDAYKKRTLTATLKYAGMELTPEAYYANSIVKACFRLILIVPCIFTVPIAIPLFLMWAIKGFMDGTSAAQKIVAEKRRAIDDELPRFAETIAQELNASRDILSLLEGYRSSAGPQFKNELDITIAGMKSGSADQALVSLSGRVGSRMLSQIVRGLLGVLRGDNNAVYFTLLAHDFQKEAEQNLEKEMLKRPGELKKYSYLMLGCFILTYMYVIFMQVFGSAGNLF